HGTAGAAYIDAGGLHHRHREQQSHDGEKNAHGETGPRKGSSRGTRRNIMAPGGIKQYRAAPLWTSTIGCTGVRRPASATPTQHLPRCLQPLATPRRASIPLYERFKWIDTSACADILAT